MKVWKIQSASVKTLGILALGFSLFCLVLLLVQVFTDGIHFLTLSFLTNFPSRLPAHAGIKSALAGTLWIMALTALISVPVGVLTGVYLNEYMNPVGFSRWIRLNIANLSGVPSVIYGMLGLAVFVRGMQLGRSVLAGALTMSLLILPVIILASIEALKAVPNSIRFGAYGVGATKTQVVWSHVLPEAFSGICTGVILALSRAIGESAPLLLIGALSYVAFLPEGPLDGFTVLSIQIFDWVNRPQASFHSLAASAIIILLVITLGMNSLAVILRIKMKARRS